MLSKTLSRIRRKLQLERLLKGAAIIVVSVLAGSLIASLLLAQSNFSDDALFWVRLTGSLLVFFLLYRYFLAPTFRPPSRRQVARFLEERNPELRERLSTAVQLSEDKASKVHPEIRQLIQKDAEDKFRRIPQPRFYFQRTSLSSLLGLATALLVFFALFMSGPAAYNFSLSKLLGLLDDPKTVLYSIDVSPGSAKIAKHSDLEVRASLNGFNADQVRIYVQYDGEPNWDEAVMEAESDSSQSVFYFFDVRDPFNYYVEAGGIRSDEHRIEVSEVPHVTEFKIELQFPAYSGLDAVILEDEGDIQALTGTVAHFAIRTDQPVSAGLIKLDSGQEIALEMPEPNLLTGSLKVASDDFYRIHVTDLEGVSHTASDEFLIQALIDQPPVLTFTEPGRDRKVTNLEEVYLELKAEDDYGIAKLSLFYSVNGDPEQELKLDYRRGSRSLTTSHTFFMEEFELIPGDFISYYAKASDAVSSAATDIYFFEVEPYEKEFRQAQQQGQQGQQNQEMQLARQQKQIIAATFKIERDRERIPPDELEENGQTLALIQQQLSIQAQTIVERIQRRLAAASDERFQKMVQYLQQAIQHMGPAHEFLNELNTQDALPEEQKSYQNLLRAESLFNEIQISMSNEGSPAASPEELADLVDLELDQKKNQYETLQQNRTQRREEALDEALEKLKDLARRQQQEAERQQRQAAQRSRSGGSSSQQQLIEEAEKLARELERLSREKPDPQLNQIARDLRQAASQMRQSQQGSQTSSEQQMRSQQALERLEKAQKALDRHRRQQREGTVEKLNRQARELLDKQRDIEEKTSQLREQLESGSIDQDFLDKRRQLGRQQQEALEDVMQLESDLHATARQMTSQEPEAAKQLKSAAIDIEDERITDQMSGAQRFSERGMYEQAETLEKAVTRDLERVAEKVSEAEQALGSGNRQDPLERLRQAQSELASTIEDLESLRERAQAAQQEGQERRQGQQGEQQEGDSQGRLPGEEQQGDGREGQRPGQEGRQQEQQGRQGQQSGEGQPGERPGQGRTERPGELAEQGEGQGRGSGDPQSPGQQEGVARSAGSSASSGIDPRAIGREISERVRDLDKVSDLLRGQNRLDGEINDVTRQLRRFDPEKLFSDPEELARLRAQVIQGLQQLELEINRALLEASGEPLRLTNPDEAPPQYRRKVEQYYEALATEKEKKN